MIPYLYIAGGAVAAAAVISGTGAWTARGVIADRDASAAAASYAAAMQAAEAEARAAEQRTALKVQEVTNAATTRTRVITVARRSADAAGNGLRVRADAASAAASASAAAGECAAAARAADVLADVLKRLESAGRELAAVADERGAAGATCEAWADAIVE